MLSWRLLPFLYLWTCNSLIQSKDKKQLTQPFASPSCSHCIHRIDGKRSFRSIKRFDWPIADAKVDLHLGKCKRHILIIVVHDPDTTYLTTRRRPCVLCSCITLFLDQFNTSSTTPYFPKLPGGHELTAPATVSRGFESGKEGI